MGTGAQTLTLAESTDARIVAIDLHEPYITMLNHELRSKYLTHQVVARVGDMRRLGLNEGSVSAIWCESAIYIMGVENALQSWRSLLDKRGFVAFSEVCWLTKARPQPCDDFLATRISGNTTHRCVD